MLDRLGFSDSCIAKRSASHHGFVITMMTTVDEIAASVVITTMTDTVFFYLFFIGDIHLSIIIIVISKHIILKGSK